MKTTWNIIKAETNRIKGHMPSKYKNSPEASKITEFTWL
jgi:hypothetical protein